MNLLVVVHVFYVEVWPEIADGLAQLGRPFDLCVTCVRDEAEIAAMVHERFPRAQVEVVDNRGFDMGPFFHVINSVNLDDYDIVVKLHTKRDVPAMYEMRGYLNGSDFRNRLLSFTRTSQSWEQSMNTLLKRGVGMVADSGVMLNRFSDPLRDTRECFRSCRRWGLGTAAASLPQGVCSWCGRRC